MAKDAWGREPIDRYNENMERLRKNLEYIRRSVEELQENADYLLDSMRGAEINLICATNALNDREKETEQCNETR